MNNEINDDPMMMAVILAEGLDNKPAMNANKSLNV